MGNPALDVPRAAATVRCATIFDSQSMATYLCSYSVDDVPTAPSVDAYLSSLADHKKIVGRVSVLLFSGNVVFEVDVVMLPFLALSVAFGWVRPEQRVVGITSQLRKLCYLRAFPRFLAPLS